MTTPFSQFSILLKKELLYVWRDKKSLYTSLFFAAFFTPLLFFGMTKIAQLSQQDNASKPKIVAVAGEDSTGFQQHLQTVLKDKKYTFSSSRDDLQSKLRSGEIHLIISQEKQQGITALTAEYDTRNNLSQFAFTEVSQQYQVFNQQRINQQLTARSVQPNEVFDTQFVPKILAIDGAANPFLTFFIPYILIIGLLQSGMQYAIETTGGEKERQTLATTLSSAASVQTVAVAKIVSVLIWSFVMTVLNIVSLLLAFKYISMGNVPGSMDFSGVGIDRGLQLLVIALPLSVLLTTLMVGIGLFARNIKEGMSYAAPLMIAGIFCAIGAQSFDIQTPMYIYAIPVLGHVIAMKQLLFGSLQAGPMALLLGVTLVCVVGMFYIVTQLFKREEVLFRV